MTSNDGKNLEQLVADLERVASGSGRKVEINRREFLDNGKQLIEFDIVVTTRSGENEHRCLIECRDRPSQGPAPGSWIEQLYGRKLLNEFHQAVAVSTTGFSEGAIHWAEKGCIELRTAEELSSPENWLCSSWITHSKTGAYSGIKIYPIDTSEQMKTFLSELQANTKEEPMLKFEKHPDLIRPKDLLQNTCLNDKYNFYEGLSPGIERPVEIKYVSIDGPLGCVSLRLGKHDIPLESVLLTGTVKITEYVDQFSSIEAVRETINQTLIGQRISIEPSYSHSHKITAIIETVNEDGSRKISLKIQKPE